MIQFNGEVVLITGGGRGIGAAIARLFGQLGARIAITYRTRQEDAEKIAAAVVDGGGEAAIFRVDLVSYKQVEAMLRQVTERFGNLNIIVNNAGIWTDGTIEDMEPQVWHDTLEVNLTGTYHVCRLGIPYLDGNRNDNIVNISSTAGQRGEPGHSHYAASKGGVISFTKSLAVELAPRNIRVNAVAPGWVETEMTARVMDSDHKEAIAGGIPLGRVGTPEDIAPAVVFLASQQASYITGEILNVNGGNVLCG